MPIDACFPGPRGSNCRTGEISWNTKDVQLYHPRPRRGHPGDRPRRSCATPWSPGCTVLPSFATVAGNGSPGVISGLSMPGIEVDLARVLHGGLSPRLHRPIPVQGHAATSTGRIAAAVYDKGKAAVLVMRTRSRRRRRGPLWTNDAQIFVHGGGGWAATAGLLHSALEPPTGAPDKVVERAIREDQPLLYRLSGDWNPPAARLDPLSSPRRRVSTWVSIPARSLHVPTAADAQGRRRTDTLCLLPDCSDGRTQGCHAPRRPGPPWSVSPRGDAA
ncbi:hypothetical protein ACRAWF_44885 [Streptomyces sp. L7]